jgi:hypothetical protein
VARCRGQGGEILLVDAFARAIGDIDATIGRLNVATSSSSGPHRAPIRQRVESIFWSRSDSLTLERHGAVTLQCLRECVAQRFAYFAAAVTLDHQLSRPGRPIVTYYAHARNNHSVGRLSDGLHSSDSLRYQ